MGTRKLASFNWISIPVLCFVASSILIVQPNSAFAGVNVKEFAQRIEQQSSRSSNNHLGQNRKGCEEKKINESTKKLVEMLIDMKVNYFHKREERLQAAKQKVAKMSDFKRIKLLGKGSFGEVWLTQNIETGKIFAVKRTLPGAKITADTLRENEIMISMDFPFIPRMYYTFEEGDQLYMVMEYAKYGDLTGLVNSCEINPEDIRVFAAQIALTLQFLHLIGVFHRDIKTDNVLLGDKFTAKLTDFGLSKQIITAPKLLRTVSNVGSPRYMAPEIDQRQRNSYTVSVDWYSFGMLLPELYGGVYDGQVFPGRTKKQRSVVLPRELLQDKPLLDLISSLMASDSAERLGGENHPFEELVEHPYFKGLDWIGVLNGSIRPQLLSFNTTTFD